ncbi:sugar ABC transporter permease [Streptomyces sp. DSM 41527]|uniref:Sugar ABC transporter permease n=1 Tax=Streptomyces mooreae TaxID=3075523 RepID=A0ABU2T8W4_9ACTN|nr:sugar ABC transporter permease [Streptomyces sp. DSM 41527]MDT0457362.1 sugar ABC transporter permease [Streptomyces sp. DSM 41527]
MNTSSETVGRTDSETAGWAGQALASLLERVSVTADEVGPRFPLYADRESRSWKSTSRGSWTGGFWAGLLWLRALSSGDPAHRAAASDCTQRLRYWVRQDTATRGLVLWYGTALAAGPGGDEAAVRLREEAARACLAAYEGEWGLVPWGDAFGGPRLLARADGVPGLVPLLARTPGGGSGGSSEGGGSSGSSGSSGGGKGSGDGRGSGQAAAYGHLTTHLDLCLAEDPPRPAWRAGPPGTWTACAEPAPGWSRTAAWLLLGTADGLHLLGDDDRLREAARQLAALRLAPGARLIPPAQDRIPLGPPDTSAAAIEAVAALKLATLARAAGDGPEGDRLTVRGRLILRQLTEAHQSDSGALLDGCYDAGHGLATHHELIWGDFFLAWGLALLTGLAEPFTM